MNNNINIGNNNNFNINNNINNNNINNNNPHNYLTNQINPEIKFLIVPENWNGLESSARKIVPQITLEDTVQKAISNFYIKLQKPREAIKEFRFNGIKININSNQKLREIGLRNGSKIIALEADNFDELNNPPFVNNNNY